MLFGNEKRVQDYSIDEDFSEKSQNVLEFDFPSPYCIFRSKIKNTKSKKKAEKTSLDEQSGDKLE